MRLLKSLTLAATVACTFAAYAEDVPYVQANTCDPAPYTSVREYWDQTGTFCIERDGAQQRYKISKMGEIKLRDHGKVVAGEYYDALSDENRAIVNQYRTYYVRYFALGDAKIGENTPFVTHIFFNWGGSSQTIFAFGEISPTGDVRLTGFSSSQNIERHYRAAYFVFHNLFWGRDPLKAGAEESKHNDQKRIEPAKDVIKHFRKKDSVLPELPSLPKL